MNTGCKPQYNSRVINVVKLMIRVATNVYSTNWTECSYVHITYGLKSVGNQH